MTLRASGSTYGRAPNPPDNSRVQPNRARSDAMKIDTRHLDARERAACVEKPGGYAS